MEGKTTLAWVALPKGKEPNIASVETFAFANISTCLNHKSFIAKLLGRLCKKTKPYLHWNI